MVASHNDNLVSHLPSLSPSSCPEACEPTTFTLRDISYLRYEVSPYMPESQPNSTELAFELVNEANGISTGCACQNVMSHGQWADDSHHWYACIDRSITVGNQQYSVRTSALVSWDDWQLAINQTWVCDDGAMVSQVSALTLAPNCTENRTASQYIKECTAPDIQVTATTQ
ncbi:hypothetical protein F5Y19DRAFT_478992 [Xylariaceae sp. FL1651]|nr:hypothetical protein F5Y19DRAFT_478992 [Xylariaceae sp. FL1651]